jgi:hypothetical protein
MSEIESTFLWVLRSAGAAGFAIYAIIIILWSLLVTGLDNKGTNEPHLQSTYEYAFMGYGVFVAGVLIWLAWRVTFSDKPFGVRVLVFPGAILAFHYLVVLLRAEGEVLMYLSVSHVPLLIGIVLLGYYIWSSSKLAHNNRLQFDAAKPRD